MSDIVLSPTIDHLSQEYLLVPAWKKAHDYIRRHNWYSDVLELDLTNADLGRTVRDIIKEIQSEESMEATPLRLVLAPKSQSWHIHNEQWVPVDGPAAVEKKLRPLAHLSARDQILGTAFMMLTADIVESRQGDPRVSAKRAHNQRMVSYGHRLFCDQRDGQLRFRWGNAGVYRQYFQDYQNFVIRPEQMIDEFFDVGDSRWAIVSADLSQFYDRVRPELLHNKVGKLLGKRADTGFVKAFESFFNWSWYESDAKDALKYASLAKPISIPKFDRIALPQGLVSSGYFSNIVLLDFDKSIADRFEVWSESEDWQLLDYCRYVDDMRFVVRISDRLSQLKPAEIEAELITAVAEMLRQALDEHAPGLLVNPEKCGVVLGKNAAAGSIKLSSSMRRVNRNASGVMDLFVGEETLELIETLLYSTEANSLNLGGRFQDSILAAKPDVGENTVARFAANRFRSAFRTLRPMSETAEDQQQLRVQDADDDSEDWNSARFRLNSTLTQDTLDHKAIHFSSRLVERWIRDPSNLRLLRVALDLRPDVETLNVVLDLLNEYLGVKTKRKAPRRVAWYCAAEILKAGATETGLVDDAEKLPQGVDLQAYQTRLAELAQDVVIRKKSFPWYLVQQAYLYLACLGKYHDHRTPHRSTLALRHYVFLHKVLNGAYEDLPPNDVPRFALLHASLQTPEKAAKALLKRLTKETTRRQSLWLVRILREHRPLARAIWGLCSRGQKKIWEDLFWGYGVLDGNPFPVSLDLVPPDVRYTLLDVSRSPTNPFQHEYLAVHFALRLIPLLKNQSIAVTPNRVLIGASDWNALASTRFPITTMSFNVEIAALKPNDSRFILPNWVTPEDRWKYQLGMLLRVLLTGLPDYTLDGRPQSSKSRIVYQPYRSSWLRRRYGMFNGRTSFGPPWAPISSWFGTLLNKLLKWPGFPNCDFDLDLPDSFDASQLSSVLIQRIAKLEQLYGRASGVPLLPISVPKSLGFSPNSNPNDRKQMLQRMRIGVAQTVLPRMGDFESHGAQLMDPCFRRKHRNHSAAVLAGIQRMLRVRTTHQEAVVGIELLILPELSIHRADVSSLLIPFVKQNRCIVCAGLVFHSVNTANEVHVVNSAVWIIPVRKPSGGIDVEVVYQGKQHLTSVEKSLGISSFRPAQWILEIVDPQRPQQRLWAMSGSVCYDATDLCLAADLRNETDLFVVPALNLDVGTFDNMAASLHYHMFQHVIVANTGEFGGSSCHAPFKKPHRRTVFHTHGNEQVAVSFFEVDLDLYRIGGDQLKTPPANHRRST